MWIRCEFSSERRAVLINRARNKEPLLPRDSIAWCIEQTVTSLPHDTIVRQQRVRQQCATAKDYCLFIFFNWHIDKFQHWHVRTLKLFFLFNALYFKILYLCDLKFSFRNIFVYLRHSILQIVIILCKNSVFDCFFVLNRTNTLINTD